jgi:hypothetical protein
MKAIDLKNLLLNINKKDVKCFFGAVAAQPLLSTTTRSDEIFENKKYGISEITIS